MAEGAKRSPELIQLLELHTQFATITPYSTVSLTRVSSGPGVGVQVSSGVGDGVIMLKVCGKREIKNKLEFVPIQDNWDSPVCCCWKQHVLLATLQILCILNKVQS